VEADSLRNALFLLMIIGVLLVYAVPEAAFVLPARVTISMQPARLSEILGSVKMLVDQVSENLPGRHCYQSSL
jgi:hypothetical protein